MKTKREYSFDILRVISMAMVVVIHVSNVYSRQYAYISDFSYLTSLFFNTVSRISVPIFLMISGALLLDREFDSKKYKKRIVKFLRLIIIWNIIYLVWEYFYLGNTYNQLYKLLLQPYRAHLWFLYTILLLYFLQPQLRYILNKANKNQKLLLLFIWIFFSTISVLNTTIAHIFTIFSYMGFFIIGKYVYDFVKTKNIKKYNKQLIGIMIICFLLSILFNYYYSKKYNIFYNLYFAYRTPFIMCSSIIFYSLVISNYQKKSLDKRILTLSDLSLGVYLIHGIFLDIMVKEFAFTSIHAIIGIPFFSTIIFLVSIVTTYLLKKGKIGNHIM